MEPARHCKDCEISFLMSLCECPICGKDIRYQENVFDNCEKDRKSEEE